MKKKFFGIGLLACLMLGAIACPSKNSPSTPANPTNTPTVSVPTNTATPVTPGITLTPVANVTPCSTVAFQANYDFTNGVQCWVADAGSTAITGIGTVSTVQHNGHNVLCVTLNNSSASTVVAQIELNYSTAQNFGGASVTAFVSADSNLISTGGSSLGFSVFNQNTGYTGWQVTGYANLSTAGTWVQNSEGSNFTNSSVIQFGVQVYNIAPGAHGNIYIADVDVVIPTAPTATPTFTLTPNANYTWDFENNALHNTFDTTDSWAQPSSGFISGIPFVTAPTVSDGSSYCMAVPVTYTAQNQLAGAIIGFTTPINVSALTGVRAQMYIDSAAIPSDCTPGGVLQVGDGANYPESGWQNLTKGGWVQLNYPISSWGTFTTTNLTMIQCIANTGGSGTFTSFSGTGNVEVDNVELY